MEKYTRVCPETPFILICQPVLFDPRLARTVITPTSRIVEDAPQPDSSYIYIYIYIYMHVHTFIHTYIYIYIYIYIYVFVFLCLSIYLFVYTCKSLRSPAWL